MKVLLTRPLNQAKTLEPLLTSHHHQPILFPTLVIKPQNETPLHKHYDAIIFISVNAVDYGIEIFRTLNVGAKVFAVGAATAQKLKHFSVKVAAFVADKPSSEALLAMDEVAQIISQKVLIFRGKGGRETLKTGLIKQNNQVEYLSVYERTHAKISATHQSALAQFLADDNGVIIITSTAGLAALIALVGAININFVDKIKQYPLIVLSPRIQQYAQSIGFKNSKIVAQISDNGVIQTLKTFDK